MCSVTPLPAKTFEGIDVLLRVRPTSTVRIVTIYCPPLSGKNTTHFSELITECSHVLDRAAPGPTEYVMVGDSNVHYGDLRRPNVCDLSELLKDNKYTQHFTEPTHVGDLVITRDTPDNIVADVSVDTSLSDHNIVQWNLLLVKPRRPRQKITYRKYRIYHRSGTIDTINQPQWPDHWSTSSIQLNYHWVNRQTCGTHHPCHYNTPESTLVQRRPIWSEAPSSTSRTTVTTDAAICT